MGFDSKPISEQRVYAQNTPPEGRDGVLWVDTSTKQRTTYVYSNKTQQFEPVVQDTVRLQKSAPENTHHGLLWVDTSGYPASVNIYSHSNTVQPSAVQGTSTIDHYITNHGQTNTTTADISTQYSDVEDINMQYTINKDRDTTQAQFDCYFTNTAQDPMIGFHSRDNGATGDYDISADFPNELDGTDLVILIRTDSNNTDYGGEMIINDMQINMGGTFSQV